MRATYDELKKVLEGRSIIAYQAHGIEIDVTASGFPLRVPSDSFFLPATHTSNPDEWAVAAKEKMPGLVALLIPGTAFDEHGTRHGRGYGWYDRFLSSVPREWVRIGVAPLGTFSTTVLTREKWDEPMDWILAETASGFEYYRTN